MVTIYSEVRFQVSWVLPHNSCLYPQIIIIQNVLKTSSIYFFIYSLWQPLHWGMQHNCVISGNKTGIPHRKIIKRFKMWSWLPEQPDPGFKKPNYIILSKYCFLREIHLAKQIILEGVGWGGEDIQHWLLLWASCLLSGYCNTRNS